MSGSGAFVANHVSWLDILVLNASKRVVFVAKAEVAGWSGIGWLARGTGTVFLERDPKRAVEQARLLQARLAAGHTLLIFPEGTSTDGLRVVPFRTTLFAAFFGANADPDIRVQPATIAYTAPKGEAATFYGWWGDASLGESLLAVLSARPQGSVRVTYHAALRVAEFSGRKTLAAAAEGAVRSGLSSQGRGQ